MNADGADVNRLTDPRRNAQGPSWSPDGTKIAFAGDRHGHVYVINADGTEETNSGGAA